MTVSVSSVGVYVCTYM